MVVRVVRLGTRRHPREGLRIGTVRRPPRGVSKSKHASGDWYDVWLPNLAPSAPLVAAALTATDQAEWRRFTKRYTAEMARPENARVLDALAALSQQADFSVGCYCEDEERCHRGILRAILKRHGAKVVG